MVNCSGKHVTGEPRYSVANNSLLIYSFTPSNQSQNTLWSCQNVCNALSYLPDNIYIRFGNRLYRQIVGRWVQIAPLS